jgi:hypothetical protein
VKPPQAVSTSGPSTRLEQHRNQEDDGNHFVSYSRLTDEECEIVERRGVLDDLGVPQCIASAAQRSADPKGALPDHA